MIELFLPLELGNQLKELGFDKTCLTIKSVDSDNLFFGAYKSTHVWYEHTLILWQQAFDWFEEKFGLCGIYSPSGNYEILNKNHPLGEWGCIFEDISDEPKIDCLKKLITICKS